MHIPPAFQVKDTEDIHDAIDSIDLANLVNLTEEGLLATPVPLYLERNEGELGTLYGHIAAANKQNKLAPKSEALVIFQGHNCYVSPSWYATKQITGKVVPTWDYLAVHAHGPLEFITDREQLLKIVTKLSVKHETKYSNWKVSDAPEKYVEQLMKAIIGIRIPIQRFEASAKLSQDKSTEDRAGVLNGVDGTGNEAMSELMREH